MFQNNQKMLYGQIALKIFSLLQMIICFKYSLAYHHPNVFKLFSFESALMNTQFNDQWLGLYFMHLKRFSFFGENMLLRTSRNTVYREIFIHVLFLPPSPALSAGEFKTG